jgi:hypothetical protein
MQLPVGYDRRWITPTIPLLRFFCMLSFRACQSFLLIVALAACPAFASSHHHAATSGHHHHLFHRRHRSRHSRRHVALGQRGIAPERAREIQQALIKQNYLTGTPSGEWDAETEKAMQKYQADHGWQTRLTPDSRALIMLGLGPNDSADGKLLNTETASAPVNPAPATDTLASTHIIQN